MTRHVNIYVTSGIKQETCGEVVSRSESSSARRRGRRERVVDKRWKTEGRKVGIGIRTGERVNDLPP
jgi:hypothetical protein